MLFLIQSSNISSSRVNIEARDLRKVSGWAVPAETGPLARSYPEAVEFVTYQVRKEHKQKALNGSFKAFSFSMQTVVILRKG